MLFDDILIYSSSWADHLRHVHAVLQLLREHQLFLKRSKCHFGEEKVANLGHVVSAAGVAMDDSKIKAVLDWLRPRMVRALRGFLGLVGYYRKFIKDFSSIAVPLTNLLKEGFMWSEAATLAFDRLKTALTTTPILQLPDFGATFIVECDGSGTGFGGVLHQGEGAIAFFSKAISARHAKLAAYERELIGLVYAVRHWRPYLWGQPFRVLTDHFSLKYLLDQRLSTLPQHRWVSKLFGYDFQVEFKPGRLNTVLDAWSRRDLEDHGGMMAISRPSFDLFNDVRQETATDPTLVALAAQLQAGP